MLAYLNTLYNDSTTWMARRAVLKRKCVSVCKLMRYFAQRTPQLNFITCSKIRWLFGSKFCHRNIIRFVCERINLRAFAEREKALILCPNGHWAGGRYNSDEQTRFATLARMGAVCVSYDLFGWGESALQVSSAASNFCCAYRADYKWNNDS